MAKELPFFKFEPAIWDSGKIQMCSHQSKGVFIDVCALYWIRLGELPYALALQKVCNGNTALLEELKSHEIIGVISDKIVIDFLDEQLEEFEITSQKRRESANKRWSNANALQMKSKSNARREDKRREEEIREEKNPSKGTVEKIVSFLNAKTGANYRSGTRVTADLIRARLNEGFTEQDFRTVIEKKTTHWQGTDYEKFLRPQTLFGTKFESYLNEREKSKPKTAVEMMEERIKNGTA